MTTRVTNPYRCRWYPRLLNAAACAGKSSWAHRQAMLAIFLAPRCHTGATARCILVGRPGTALAALLLDAVMLAWVLRAARRLDIVNRATLRGLLRGEQLREGLRAAREKFGR